MSYIISEIENNEIVDLHVSDEDEELMEDDIEEFIDALSNNTSIQTIHFDGEFLGCLRGSDRSEVIKTIGNIPTLREVHMNRSLVMVKDISTLVSQARQLQVLKMNYIVFQGVAADHEACEVALHQHTGLKAFEMYKCSAAAVKNVTLEKLEKAGQKFSADPSSTAGGGNGQQTDCMYQVGTLVA